MSGSGTGLRFLFHLFVNSSDRNYEPDNRHTRCVLTPNEPEKKPQNNILNYYIVTNINFNGKLSCNISLYLHAKYRHIALVQI